MSFNAKDMTQGGQIASMRIRMFSQIANIMLYCLFIFFWILVGLVLWVKISWQTFVNGCIYWWCTTLEGMRDLIKSQPAYSALFDHGLASKSDQRFASIRSTGNLTFSTA
ncbi:TraD N-terminal domain-containing protein, partial [Escherichia coli]|uniref:TraD N-terminal domain-containing protein n=1 Tax=Escherichia coli TaxID=562 RepID=UPI0024C4CD2B